jgi:phage baseplate assembly protein W
MAIIGVAAKKALRNPIGQGWKFPFSFDANGGVAGQASTTDNEAVELINEALQVIIGTTISERVIRRTFGSKLKALVDEPIDDILVMEIKQYVIEAIARYERRIALFDTYVDTSNENQGMVLIEINYQILRTQQRGNMVYPFYLEHEESA